MTSQFAITHSRKNRTWLTSWISINLSKFATKRARFTPYIFAGPSTRIQSCLTKKLWMETHRNKTRRRRINKLTLALSPLAQKTRSKWVSKSNWISWRSLSKRTSFKNSSRLSIVITKRFSRRLRPRRRLNRRKLRVTLRKILDPNQVKLHLSYNRLIRTVNKGRKIISKGISRGKRKTIRRTITSLKNIKRRLSNTKRRNKLVKMSPKTLKKFGKPKIIPKSRTINSINLNTLRTSRSNNIRGKISFSGDSRIKMGLIQTTTLRLKTLKWMPVSWKGLKSSFQRAAMTSSSIISMSKTHLKTCRDSDLASKTLAKISRAMMGSKWTIIKIRVFNTKTNSTTIRMEFTTKTTSSSSMKTGMADNSSMDTIRGLISSKWAITKGTRMGTTTGSKPTTNTMNTITANKPTGTTMRWVSSSSRKAITPDHRANRSTTMASFTKKTTPMTTLIQTFDKSNETRTQYEWVESFQLNWCINRCISQVAKALWLF